MHELSLGARRDGHDQEAADEANTADDRKRDGGHASASERTLLLDVVDLIERIHDREEREDEIPQDKCRREDDQPHCSRRHDLHGRVVDRVVNRRSNVRSNLRRNALPPRVLQSESAEQAKREERDRNQGEDGAKADRRRVQEQAVLAEFLDELPKQCLS